MDIDVLTLERYYLVNWMKAIICRVALRKQFLIVCFFLLNQNKNI